MHSLLYNGKWKANLITTSTGNPRSGAGRVYVLSNGTAGANLFIQIRKEALPIPKCTTKLLLQPKMVTQSHKFSAKSPPTQ